MAASCHRSKHKDIGSGVSLSMGLNRAFPNAYPHFAETIKWPSIIIVGVVVVVVVVVNVTVTDAIVGNVRALTLCCN